MTAAIKGPALFLAQFMGDAPPCDSWANATRWAAGLGYRGVQVPAWDARCIDLAQAAASKTYCDEFTGIARSAGIEITELAAHLQGQLVAVHPAFDAAFDGFAPPAVRGNPAARTAWAVEQMRLVIDASRNLGLSVVPSFTGALLWPTLYPWPQRPAGLVQEGFAELARRWRPILDHADRQGVDIAWEVHPGEDVHDGATLERMLDALGQHPRANILYDPSHLVLQGMDYSAFIDHYHSRIRAFHVKDAEFRPDGRTGAYGGYLPWVERAGRFRSLGDGQIDFARIFSQLTRYGYQGWAVVEWECCLKDPNQGAAEGVPFVESYLIRPCGRSFDDFAGAGVDRVQVRRMLGLEA